MTPRTSKSSRARTVKPRSAGSALGGIIGAVAMCLIAGVLVTAAVTPVVALSGMAATTAVDIFEKLPNHLNPGQLAEPSTLYAKAADGSDVELATFYDQDRKTVKWEDISQYAKDATVAEEDPRFYTHGGVDVLASGRAVLQNAAGSGYSGASTVTMQYVRNVRIQEALAIPDKKESDAEYKAAMKDSIERKLQEMKYAISIEKKYSKDEILLGYLNIALFGRKVYGIESAANYYFGKTAKDLTLPEAASLVATVNNPAKLQIDIPKNIPANKERRDKILNSMLRTGKITQAQHDEAIATPVTPNIHERIAGCNIAEQNHGLGAFCDYVIRTIKKDKKFGETPEEAAFNFSRGGYKIYTTIDLDMQWAAKQATNETVPALADGIDVGSATSSVQVGTGRVLTMTQNKPFNNAESFLKDHPDYTTINYNTDYEDGGSSGFQVGSTFKPITLAEWIRTGHSVRDIVQMDGRTVQLQSFKDSCAPDGVYGYGSWSFTNDNLGTRGNQPALIAIRNSVNGGLISMQQKMDLCDTYKLAEKLGIHRAAKLENPDMATFDNFGTTKLTRVPSGVFGGVDEIAPITMASAYAAFAGDGTVCTPMPIDKIEDSDGNPVAFTGSKCTEGVSPEVAAGVAYALQDYINNGNSLMSYARSAHGIPHLGKTGTTDDAVDNWSVGASSKVATATWVGNAGPVCAPDGTNCGRRSTFGYSFQTADQTIWPAVMNVADLKYQGDAFPEPSASATQVTMDTIPDVKGKSYEEASNMLTQVGFNVVDGGEVDSSVAQGMVANTDPGAGASVPRGSNIAILRSNGQASPIPDGLVGATGNSAKSTLSGAGFSNVDFSCQAGGRVNPSKDKVVSVDPASGTEVRSDKQITLSLACSKK
ncbi:PASTA domain-containing protein [Leucobacter viscericola]|uniref:PASTA domain-containing protein n=1 Tax=Leucobacter viscericola TaxID=2714935 RepID=A0A6G7XHC8_9MICO|nr:transglycosylase domain-containing protein [Leucobacter viscericola]QIK63953.1 PASTA domain-containing protein [Leucobacter viscericola]